jgi:transposase
MEPYTVEFRAEVLAAYDAKEGTRAIAARLNVSDSWIRRIVQQRRETGQLGPRPVPPQKPKWLAWADWLVAKITARPDIYLRELQAELKAERGEEVTLTTISNACRALELTRKKRLLSPASKIAKTSPKNDAGGAKSSRMSRSKKSYLSTKRGRKPT